MGNFELSAGFARSVSIEEIRQNDYDFQPRLYVREENEFRSTLADTPLARLESLQRELDDLTEQAKRTRRNVDTYLKALHDLPPGSGAKFFSVTSVTSRQDREQSIANAG